MDSGTVKTFCDSAAQILPQLGAYAAAEHNRRTPEDDALVRELQVASAALANALIEVARMTPPPRPPMPQAPPATPAPS